MEELRRDRKKKSSKKQLHKSVALEMTEGVTKKNIRRHQKKTEEQNKKYIAYHLTLWFNQCIC